MRRSHPNNYGTLAALPYTMRTWHIDGVWAPPPTTVLSSMPYENAIDLTNSKASLMHELKRYANDECSLAPRLTVDAKPYRIGAKAAAEAVGTAFFVFTGILSALSHSADATTGVALAHGLAIAAGVAAFAHISGAHLNPAVSVSITVAGRMKAWQCIVYVVAQLVGAVAGACLVRLVTLTTDYEFLVGGATILPEPELWAKALVAEALLTAILTNVVLAVGVDVSGQPTAPLAIGLTVAAGVFSIKTISGACMNPARSFGPAVAALIFLDMNGVRAAGVLSSHYVFWAGPLLGASISALLYRLLFARGHNRLLF